jgi:hypothetical protein
MEEEINNELRSFVLDEIDKMKEKLHKMDNQMTKVLKDNQVLSAKVNNLETIIEKLTNTQINSKNKSKNNIEEEEATWLYYIPKGISLKKISAQLELSADGQALEINVGGWDDEVT